MVVLVVIFLCTLLVSFFVVLAMGDPKNPQQQMQSRLSAVVSASVDEKDDSDIPLADEDAPARASLFLQQFGFSRKIQEVILHADTKTTVTSVVLGSAGLALCLAALAYLITKNLPLTAVCFGVGAYARYGVLKWKAGRRLKAFNGGLGDSIDLMARALRAGHSVGSSIEIVAEQSPEPLSSEFRTCFQQQKLGVPFRDALLQMGDRVPSKDLHFVITAVLIQRETGGDLTEILDRTTEVIRERTRIEGEVRTYTAQGRLTGWILGLLPLALLALINLITPGYSSILFHDPIGQKLLYAGATLICIGILIIRKIVDIKV